MKDGGSENVSGISKSGFIFDSSNDKLIKQPDEEKYLSMSLEINSPMMMDYSPILLKS